MLQAPALSEVFNLLEEKRRLIASAGVLVAPAHLDQGGIALRGGGVPVQSVPLGTKELTEWIAGRKADPNPIGSEPFDGRRTEVLRLTDSHGSEA